MAVWLREIAGWLLIGAGLVVFGLTYVEFLLKKRLLEAIPAVFIGYVVFRGGMHLIKVAIAARASREAKLQTAPVQPTHRVLGQTRSAAEVRGSVIPGPNTLRPVTRSTAQ
jgi:xanthine/uracil permease